MTVRPQQSDEQQQEARILLCDVLIVGSGAAGLMAALTARHAGADVLVLEKEAFFGGTSAVSGGWLWIPENPVAKRLGVQDSINEARKYLQHEAGMYFDPERVEAFLAAGPEMVDFCEKYTGVRFMGAPMFPDYHPGAPGGGYGRSICSQPFDARQLGSQLQFLRRPLRALTFLGMAVSSGAELRHFMNATRSLSSALFVARRLTKHASDIAIHGRGMRLTNGNALIASLLASAVDAGVRLESKTSVLDLIREGEAVVGAHVMHKGRVIRVQARKGVVLATGGFPHDNERRRKTFAAASNSEICPLPPTGNTGDGLNMAESVGAKIVDTVAQPAAWAPTSIVQWRDGERGGYIHVIDRAKPGVIAVTKNGRRFVNEASSYHDFVIAMMKACGNQQPAEAFLICDHSTLRRYGLGFVKPSPIPIGEHLKSGYLITGQSIAELARKAGIDSVSLEQTIFTFNVDARQGRDSQFEKGKDPYDRYMGNADALGNPCVGPLEHGPFYAIRVIPGCLSTYVGLSTDANARVLTSQGTFIKGLYAVGSDMLTIAGGGYLGAGANLGPGMTFGYIAGRELGKEVKSTLDEIIHGDIRHETQANQSP